MSRSIPLLVVLTLCVLPAAAQEPAQPTFEPLPFGQVNGVLGRKVKGPQGEAMGFIVDVLIDGNGQPAAAVIDFGGFLGVGSRKVAVDWRLLRNWDGGPGVPLVLSLGRDEVRAAPEYKPKQGATAQMLGPSDVQ